MEIPVLAKAQCVYMSIFENISLFSLSFILFWSFVYSVNSIADKYQCRHNHIVDFSGGVSVESVSRHVNILETEKKIERAIYAGAGAVGRVHYTRQGSIIHPTYSHTYSLPPSLVVSQQVILSPFLFHLFAFFNHIYSHLFHTLTSLPS